MFRKIVISGLIVLGVVGCSGNPAVGTWKATGQMGEMTLTLNADKTFTSTINMSGNSAPFESGTYSMNGKEIDMNGTKMAGTDIPTGAGLGNSKGTLSDDNKTLTIDGVPYTKQ